MRNLKHLFMSFALLSLFACSSEKEDMTQGTSKVMLDLGTELTYGKKCKSADTRSVDLTPYKDVSKYTVHLIKNGEIIKQAVYGQMELLADVEPGTYTFKAFYGDNDVAAAWDALYVEGSKEFTAQAGRTEKVQFTCVPANAKMKVVYSPDFADYYSDCAISVTTKYQTSPFVIAKADAEADKEAYFKVDAGENVFTLSFDLKDKQGVSVTPKNFGEQTVKVHPRDFLTLTVKPSVVEVEGGKIDGVQVTVDNGLTEEVVNVTVPDEFVKE